MQVGMNPGETGRRRASLPSSKELRAPGSQLGLSCTCRKTLPALAAKTSHCQDKRAALRPLWGSVCSQPRRLASLLHGLHLGDDLSRESSLAVLEGQPWGCILRASGG